MAFNIHLMKSVLGITNDLSLTLQRKDQDIVNAITQVKVSKHRLQKLRDEGWKSLLIEISSYCEKNSVTISIMDDFFILPGRPRRNAP